MTALRIALSLYVPKSTNPQQIVRLITCVERSIDGDTNRGGYETDAQN